MNVGLILSCLGTGLYSLSFLICLSMSILILIRIRPLKSNIAVLLVLNTYVTCFIASTLMLFLYSYNLSGNLDPSRQFDGVWCRIRSYIVHVCFCSAYYSFVVQAVFRLFRIVFYRRRILQSFGVCLIGICVQWLSSMIFILPNLILGDFQYLKSEFNCWIAFENLRGLVMATIMIFNNPLSIIFTIYTQIIRYSRRTSDRQRQRNANKRDLLVLKRIFILVFVIVGIGLPTVVVILIYITTNNVIPYAYHIQGLCISLGVVVASISLIFITPQIQQIFYPQNRNKINPNETILFTTTRQMAFE